MDTDVVTARIDKKLATWLREKAVSENCKINDVIKDAILAYKQFDELPKNMQFSELMLMQGAKSAMMAYRLLARFVVQAPNGGEGMVRAAFDFTNTEFEQFRINTHTMQKID